LAVRGASSSPIAASLAGAGWNGAEIDEADLAPNR
jgi:hypothetical protein